MDRSRKRYRSSRSTGAQELKDIPPELIHHIQSRLPVNEAARTSVLSKSWLHAWSTIPTLRFHHQYPTRTTLGHMDRTLMRYLRNNIPIETFELIIEFEDQESACLVEKWILLLATKTRVKELSIVISRSSCFHAREVLSFNFPYEILSSENLTKLKVTACLWFPHSARMTSSKHHHPVIIKCSSLRELHLSRLHISQKILDGILSSSSSSLQKVHLSQCCSLDLNTINVKNLPCLHELSIDTNDYELDFPTDFVISHLPNLRSFSLHVSPTLYEQPTFNANLISLAAGSNSLTQLSLEGVIMDTTTLDLIKSGFPFLKSLHLHMSSWMYGSFHFTCASIKSLSLLDCRSELVDVQIHAPKLCYFRFKGYKLPTTFLFPISTTLNQLDLKLHIDMGAVDASFFLRMREALALSRKCHLDISTYNSNWPPWDIDIKYLRTRLRLPPATNVEDLRFETYDDECRWKRSPFFDAFFEICHPDMVFAMRETVYSMADGTFKHSNHFCRLMLLEVLENSYKNKTPTQTQTVYWPHCLEHVKFIVNPYDPHENWKTLTNSKRSLIDGLTPFGMHFKLKWR